MNPKKYINIRIAIREEYYDLAYGALYSYPISGIEEKFDELIVTFEYDQLLDGLRESLIAELCRYDKTAKIIEEDIFDDRNWNEEYEKQTPLLLVNERIGIAPEWKVDELDTDIKIIINPKMSFGTGEHATTKMVCQLLEKVVIPGSYWIDAGCGTGLLGILALKLGSKEIFAFDYDEWSVENTKENLKLNGLEKDAIVIQDKIENIILPPSDGIAANMFSNLLINSMPKFSETLKESKGVLLVSGILKYDMDEVVKIAIKNGFELIDTRFEDEWVALHFNKL